MILLLMKGETLTSRLCEEQFHITLDTAVRDFNLLVELGLARTFTSTLIGMATWWA
jgi:hypothetical protein